MTQKPARGTRGFIIWGMEPDTNPVFRVYGEPDPATGQRPHTDYELRVDDLSVEITSDYFVLNDPASGESGVPYVGYKGRKKG